jgi:N-acetylmuramoyl-L-alanine amidase
LDAKPSEPTMTTNRGFEISKQDRVNRVSDKEPDVFLTGFTEEAFYGL